MDQREQKGSKELRLACARTLLVMEVWVGEITVPGRREGEQPLLSPALPALWHAPPQHSYTFTIVVMSTFLKRIVRFYLRKWSSDVGGTGCVWELWHTVHTLYSLNLRYLNELGALMARMWQSTQVTLYSVLYFACGFLFTLKYNYIIYPSFFLCPSHAQPPFPI